MKYLGIRLLHYKMIKSGLDLNEIYIDLRKQKHKLCIIVGDNGSGKSTILNALTLYPDNKEQFIDTETAEKEIWAMHGDTAYRSLIVSIPNPSGRTTKAYFQKNGIELNPNGNVNSYKEIMESEFDLDSNALLLSYLSFNQRGLADMKPGERKRYVSGIISTLDVYNNMNKNFSKKVSIIRSHINSIHNKINSIGNPTDLSITLDGLDIKVSSLKQKRDVLKSTITASETIINSMDPDKSIQEKYKEIYDLLSSLTKEIEAKENMLSNIKNKINNCSYEECLKKIKELKEIISTLEGYIIKTKAEMDQIQIQMKTDEDDLLMKHAKLDQITEKDFDKSLEANIEAIQREIYDLTEQNSNEIYWNMSEQEVDRTIDILNLIERKISNFYDAYNEEIISYCIKRFMHPSNSLAAAHADLEILEKQYNVIEKTISDLEISKTLLDDLNKRPASCLEDDCYFIKRAIETRNKYGSINKIDEVIKKLQGQMTDNLSNQEHVKEKIKLEEKIKEALYNLNEIISLVRTNYIYLNRTKENKKFEISNLLKSIENFESFEWIFGFIELLQKASSDNNNINEKQELLSSLATKFQIQNANANLINELKESIAILAERIESAKTSIGESINSLDLYEKTISEHKKNYEVFSTFINLYQELQEYQKEKETLRNEYSKIKDNIKAIGSHIDTINTANSELNAINKELEAVEIQRDTYRYSLTMINDYQIEMAKYQENFDILNTLKKYSSPNTGIQTLFVSMYMNQTKEIVNDLIKNFFNGELLLSDYVINENEFRIPCTKGGWSIDDISSCSNAQICVMSMCISMALLHQASSIFNIPRWDEIDNGLDYTNSILFIQMLYHLIAIFNVEQSFLISHASESVLTDVDIIALKYNFNDNPLYGNVIYNYKEESKEENN